MVVPSEEPSQDNTADRFPLLMEPQESNETLNHIIDVQAGCDGSSSSSSHYNTSSCGAHHEDIPSSSVHLPASQLHASSLDGLNSRSSSITQRREGESGRRQWSPFNTILWLSIELVFTVGQITAAIVVLSVSRHEKPKTPLFAWVVGYAVGCAASLPILYWRYLHRYQRTEPGPAQLGRGDSSPGNSLMVDPNAYITISVARASEEGNSQNTSSGAWNGQTLGASNARLSAFMDHLKMALDCFFAVWFVVGNVWIFGGHSSSSVAPNLYRLCIVFLTFSCIGYAMPFILCSMICCCLPCIISILGIRDDMNRMRGASEETINALPTLKFKSKEKETLNNSDSNSGADAGGLVAAGTEKERVISGEDAVCCICLARYADNDELRELPCSHFFHTECVDKWLKINATCPLCKTEIGASDAISPSVEDPTQQV